MLWMSRFCERDEMMELGRTDGRGSNDRDAVGRSSVYVIVRVCVGLSVCLSVGLTKEGSLLFPQWTRRYCLNDRAIMVRKEGAKGVEYSGGRHTAPSVWFDREGGCVIEREREREREEVYVDGC